MTELSAITFLATLSYPSPIDTFEVYFFFFLAKSSIDDVGSAPADNKNNTGQILVVSYHVYSIG